MVDFFNAIRYSYCMDKIELHNVNSQVIQQIGWNHTKKQLLVKFRDSPTYIYPSVPKTLYDAFLASKSHGNFFITQIKNKFSDFQRLDS